MNYTLNQLRIFLKVTQTLSITKASEELHLTQPAVSIQLRNFQNQFALPLTEVVNKRLYITDFGLEIARAAENILNEAYAINDKMLAFTGNLTGRLKFSVVSTGKYVIPYYLAGFLKEHPGIELQLDVTNRARVIENLEHNEVDFSLMSIIPKNLRLRKIELLDNHLVLVGGWKSKTPEKGVRFLETIPLIFREPGSATRMAMEKFIRQNKLTVQQKLELTSNEAVKQAIMAGLGYSIVPLIGIKNELHLKQMQILPMRGLPIKSKWYLVWPADKKENPVRSAFIHYLETHKQEIRNHFSE